MSDPFIAYEVGIQRLLEHLGATHDRTGEAAIYKQRLVENIRFAQLHGDTAELQYSRSVIIAQINKLARETGGPMIEVEHTAKAARRGTWRFSIFMVILMTIFVVILFNKVPGIPSTPLIKAPTTPTSVVVTATLPSETSQEITTLIPAISTPSILAADAASTRPLSSTALPPTETTLPLAPTVSVPPIPQPPSATMITPSPSPTLVVSASPPTPRLCDLRILGGEIERLYNQEQVVRDSLGCPVAPVKTGRASQKDFNFGSMAWRKGSPDESDVIYVFFGPDLGTYEEIDPATLPPAPTRNPDVPDAPHGGFWTVYMRYQEGVENRLGAWTPSSRENLTGSLQLFEGGKVFLLNDQNDENAALTLYVLFYQDKVFRRYSISSNM